MWVQITLDQYIRPRLENGKERRGNRDKNRKNRLFLIQSIRNQKSRIISQKSIQLLVQSNYCIRNPESIQKKISLGAIFSAPSPSENPPTFL